MSAQSILFQQVLSGYIFVLANGSNRPVGIVKGIQGCAQLAFSFPSGYAADTYRRDKVLRVAGMVGLLAVALTTYAFQQNNLSWIYLSFGVWGIFSALQTASLEAIFADSVPHGQRELPFTIKYVLKNIAYAVGPALCIVLFYFQGNVWELHQLQHVLCTGCAFAALSMGFLFYFDDDEAHELKEEEQQRLRDTQVYSSWEKKEGRATETTFLLPEDELSGDLAPPHAEIRLAIVSEPNPTLSQLQSHHVPLLLFISDFIISNGAGMTINFFPLFFFAEYGLSPIHVSLLFLAQPIIIGVFSVAANALASKIHSRMIVVVTTRLAATLCLFAMAIVQSLAGQIVLFLARAGLMRCTTALRRSVMMDHVPRQARGRWNALEGLTVASWSGSAVLGGLLIDATSYRTTFSITACVYLLGVAVELILVPLTHRLEGRRLLIT